VIAVSFFLSSSSVMGVSLLEFAVVPLDDLPELPFDGITVEAIESAGAYRFASRKFE
jgi:hypothetical protein